MGVHLPKLRYHTVAALGVVFCGGYTTLDTVTGVLSICLLVAKLMCTDVYCCLCPLDPGCPIKAVKT